ncbi:IPIL1 protein, partial [Podargus strigoides]|nr:IPIL1 protein [Podargus strigoides]
MAWVLVCNFCCIFRKIIANTLLPMPHQPIKVGSAFEGWSPLEKDIIYRVFVPLLPPPWHCFKTEPCIARETPARNFQVRVDLECGCITSYSQSKGLCFLHHFRELRKNHVPNILDTLCTNFYLDVNKTAQWFHLLVTSAWKFFPLSSRCCLTMLPSSRSCKFCITGDSKSITIEMMFGVQQHSSDIFVSNESPEGIFMRNTIWSESYAVAEAKFFRELGSQAPHGSFHLECLRVCARILVGTGFSTYTLKTVVMHLLTTIPLKDWRERDFLLRLRDIMQYLRVCLEEKRLYHFFFGNKKVPKGLDLPLDLQEAEAVNLFYYLVGNPDAHAKALREFMQLRYWLTR